MKLFLVLASICLSLLVLNSAIAKNPEFDCKTGTFQSHEKKGDHPETRNGRNPGEWMKWTILNGKYGWIEFKFVEKDGNPSTESPFEDGQTVFTDTLEKDKDHVRRGRIAPIAPGEEHHYKYTITCYANGQTKTVDPIIDIPPSK